MITPFRVLAKKRAGDRLGEAEIRSLVAGAVDGSWSDAQLGAFLMAAAIHQLDAAETRLLTLAMLESGERWDLRAAAPGVCDKHSTGGVGDKVSLVLAPLLAACGRPVAMLTGRGLGHTGGTADKLESIAGLDLALDRARTLALLDEVGAAVGMATDEVAPADRKLYALRDVTATISSLPLITASILSKKLATGAAGVVYDVKVGSGAFLPGRDEARRLASMLVDTSTSLGTPARALITDMSQPLGRWVGHAAEVRETLSCLAGEGPDDLTELTVAEALEVAELTGAPLGREELQTALSSGRARETFERWAAAQGARRGWQGAPGMELAPAEQVVTAPRDGTLAAVDAREIGLLLVEAGGGRRLPGDDVDRGVALRCGVRLGDRVEAGQELVRLYLRRRDEELAGRFAACFTLAEGGAAPPLVYERVTSQAA